MIIALHNGKRKRAETAGRGEMGICPWSGFPVKAHVGAIRQYWAYIDKTPIFKNGYEPESEWHMSWKELIEDQYCEVVFGENNEHRADILGAQDTVVEIQKSVIDIRDSRKRTEFYKKTTGKRMIWLVDIQEFWRKRFFLSDKPCSKGFYSVTWKQKRSWLMELAATPDTHLYLEYNQSGDKLLQAWIHQKVMLTSFISKEKFFMKYLQASAKHEYLNFPAKALAIVQGRS